MSVGKKLKKVKEIVPKKVSSEVSSKVSSKVSSEEGNDIPKLATGGPAYGTYKFLKNPTGFTNLAYSENMVLSQEGISNIPKETMDKMIEKGYIAKI